MSDIATPILEWLNANPELAGLATFLISAGESVAIIGTIVPGSIMMTAIGALVGAGIIPFWPTLIWAILGAIVGDGVSYWLGHYFKDRIHNVWPFRNHPNLLNSGEGFFQKYGGMSVFIGRFVGPVRALVPLVAGMLGFKPLRFTIANVASAILWAPVYMLPGFLLGAASMELPSELAARVIFMLIFAVLFIILCLWLIKKIFELINQEVNQFLNWIWNSLKKSRYFHLLTHLLKHHDAKKTHGQLTLAFYFILTCIAFLYLANFILYTGPEGPTNNMIFHLFRSIRTTTLDNVMLCITLLGDFHVLLPLVITLFGYFIYTRHWHTAFHVLVFGLITIIGIQFFKYFVHSPRPWGVLGNNNAGFSFPSGHTAFAFAFYLGIALLSIKIFKIKKHRNLIYIPIALLIGFIALSRLYFGVHWLTDIVGGCLLSASIVMLVSLSYNRKTEKNIRPRDVITTVILTLIVSYSVNFYYSFNKFKHEYTMLEWPIYTIKFDSWWQQKGGYFPLYRVNRFGVSVNVFNIQWLGSLADIKELLLKNGWMTPLEHDWLSALYRITSVESTEHLPLLSPLYLDKPPLLILFKNTLDNKKLIILRFWTSQFLINNVQEPLWLGTIEFAPSTYSWLFKSKRENLLIPTPSLLFTKLPENYDIKETTVSIKPNKRTKNQNILLIKPKSVIYSHSDFNTSEVDLSQVNVGITYNNTLLKHTQKLDNYAETYTNPSGWDGYDLIG